MMETYDKKIVKEGDEVWVIGSTAIHKTKVLPSVTDYNYFGPIPVANSFSTKEAAEAYKENMNEPAI